MPIWSGLLLACLPPAAVPVVHLPPPPEEITVDYSPLFDGLSSSSSFDYDQITPALMERIMWEEDVLGYEPAAVEVWSRKLLHGMLVQSGSMVIAPPLDPDPRQPCPQGGCLDAPPTLLLRRLHFLSGTDDVDIVVSQRDENVTLSIRAGDEEESLCPAELALPLGYVELSTTLQRVSDGAIIGQVHEVALLPGNDLQVQLTVPLPPPDRDPEGFCDALIELYNHHPNLARSDQRYILAGQRVLSATFQNLTRQ